MAKKENKKVNKKNNDKKKNNKKFKDAYSIRIGPRLETWLVWISMFVLGIGFLWFGDVVFYSKVRKEKVDSVPVWTMVETETITKTFKSDSNNLKETDGFLYYGGESGSNKRSLINYNTEFNYYGLEVSEKQLSDTLRIYFQVDHYYFRRFAPDGYTLDRSLSYFNYYVEIGSNLISSVSDYGSSGLTFFDLTSGVVHSLSYSEIAASYTYATTSLVILVEKIDELNDDPADNYVRVYPSVDLTYKRNNFVDVNLKSYEVFEVEEKITRKTEMVLDYEEKVTYYDDYQFNLSLAEFNEVAVGLFDSTTSYVGKFLNIFNTVFEFLQFIFDFIVGSLVDFIGWIVGLIS